MNKIAFVILIIITTINSICYAQINDINNHWAEELIQRCINNEYINGYTDNTFRPDSIINYEEFLKILIKVMNVDITENKSNWSKPYLDYAVVIELINLSDVAKSDKSLIRSNAVDILCNYIKLYERINIVNNVDFLKQKNILQGYDDKTLGLEKCITRAEAVKLILYTSDYIDNVVYNNKTFLNNLNSLVKYTNYFSSNINEYSYRIENGKCEYINKNSNKYITEKYNKEICNILTSLINIKSYVLNMYNNNNLEVIISLAEKKEYAQNGQDFFRIHIFEENRFIDGYEYNVKIDVYKLWKELHEIKNEKKFNQFYLNKLIDVLNNFVNKEIAIQIIEKLKDNVCNNFKSEQFYLKKIGNVAYFYI